MITRGAMGPGRVAARRASFAPRRTRTHAPPPRQAAPPAAARGARRKMSGTLPRRRGAAGIISHRGRLGARGGVHGTLGASRRRLRGAARSKMRRVEVAPPATRRARPRRRRRCLHMRWPRARVRADAGRTAAMIAGTISGKVSVTTYGTICAAAMGRRRGGPHRLDGWRGGGRRRGGRRTGGRTDEATRLTVMAAAAAAQGALMVEGGEGRSREMQLSVRSWRRRSRCRPHTASPAACTRRIHPSSSLAHTSPVAEAPCLG